MSHTTAIAIVVLPFVMFVLTLCVLNPAKRLISRYMPDGKLKRALLFRVN